ncbi:hypothetical protein G7047_19320 [Diaphorobacter sp. HDW4A]|uniref:hypothetical protein n=1 Tax=Diaphorobacter sp. HDW4A TaxID=2714924 RepID=UPI00140BC807|nr:hypothetical protein [Diaphorobacter sp. HDW4A]QIL81826.1 hypothetical protein G7047_19320 [Diaphorobacter sp. HDW4A]
MQLILTLCIVAAGSLFGLVMMMREYKELVRKHAAEIERIHAEHEEVLRTKVAAGAQSNPEPTRRRLLSPGIRL